MSIGSHLASVKPVRVLIGIHMGLSLIGIIVHTIIHPVQESLYYWWASPVAVISFVLLPILFSRRSTVAWGYLLNAFTVLIGVIGMSYYAMMKPEGPVTIPYILVLLIKLVIAHMILLKMRPEGPTKGERGCRE